MSKVTGLFRANNSDKPSASHLWFHIVNGAVVYIYIIVGEAVAKMANPNIEGLAMLTFVLVGLVTGNKLAQAFMRWKYAPPVTDSKDTPNQPNS